MTTGMSVSYPKAALAYPCNVCAKFGNNKEIGGVGVGYCDKEGNPIVMANLPPGPKAEFSRCSFSDDPGYINRIMSHAEKYRLTLNSFWHLHPGSMSEPSSIDLEQSIRFTDKLEIEKLSYLILTETDERQIGYKSFWGRFSTVTPEINVHSYIFDAIKRDYVPCGVQIVDYDKLQHDFINSSLIADKYRIPSRYPEDKLNVVNCIQSEISIPESFTSAFGNIAGISPPEIYLNGKELTIEKSFDGDVKLIMSYEISRSGCVLSDAKIQVGDKCKNISRTVSKYCGFEHAYLESYIVAKSISERMV